jgi:hypothetical protein
VSINYIQYITSSSLHSNLHGLLCYGHFCKHIQFIIIPVIVGVFHRTHNLCYTLFHSISEFCQCINCLLFEMLLSMLSKDTHLINGSGVVQRSKALHLRARGITTDPGLIPGCITTGCDWESHRLAHNWPSVVRVWPG